MANELLSALETRITSAVDTIDTLRSEVKELKAERVTLEDKLRELLDRMGIMDSSEELSAAMPAMDEAEAAAPESDNIASFSRAAEPVTENAAETESAPAETRFGTYGYGSNRSEY